MRPASFAEIERHLRRAARFGVSGVLAATTDFIIFTLAIGLGAPPPLANVLSFCVANPQSYVVNSRITFGSRSAPAAISFRGYRRFALAHSVSLTFSTLFILVFAGLLGPYIAKAIALGVGFVWNYSMSARFVFGAAKTARARGSESA